MKITQAICIVLCLFFTSIESHAYVGIKKFELKTTSATLNIDTDGNLKITPNEKNSPQISTSAYDLWQVTLKNTSTNMEQKFHPGKNMLIRQQGDEVQFIQNGFMNGEDLIKAKAVFSISVKNDGFCFSGNLTSNTTNWTFKSLTYPIINGIIINPKNTDIYWPHGLGEHYNNPNSFNTRSSWYPSAMGASMPWFTITSTDGGLYIGCHDTTQSAKNFNLTYEPSNNTLRESIMIPIYDDKCDIPDIFIKSYSGKWYEASKFYRSWYNKHFTIPSPPEWVKDDPGMLLCILKQQNLNVMWSYKDIDRLCDVADKLNLNTIALFGWAVGGHDHLYPNYQPDNLLGGTEVLKTAIEKAHKRGKKIIIYANGKIMDVSTDYYRYNGIETIILKENGQPDIQFYRKQKNNTPVIFAQACTGSVVWRNTMYHLGQQANYLGADGILYDQLGVLRPLLCFSPYHDHRPGEADPKYRLEMVDEISKEIKDRNPNFIIMTEATNDVMLRGIDYTHGYGVATAPSDVAFPELYRYTFPELIETQRNPNPMITRTDANFAAVFGLRHELESRYPSDVKYLVNGILPNHKDYENVVSPPNVDKMNLVSIKKAEEYVHDLIKFENENSKFFRRGKYIALDGIDIKADAGIKASGFLSDDKIGVVIWNKNMDSKSSFSVKIKGYKLVGAKEIENSNVLALSPLPPNSLRLLVYEKN